MRRPSLAGAVFRVPRLVSVGALRFHSSTAATQCLLCDTTHSDWNEHLMSSGHIARHVVCSALVVPSRHEVMMKQLWDHIQLDFQQLDEAAAKKEAKRRGRLMSSMTYLKEQGVIFHSLVHAAEGEPRQAPCDTEDVGDADLGVSTRFSSLLAVGTTFAQREVLDRVARLLPDAVGDEVTTIVDYVLCQRNLGHLFKLLNAQQLLAPSVRLQQLRSDTRAAMLLSILGELQLFSRQPRSRNVVDPATADLLVLNVLATHVMDNVLSELTHVVLQKIVDEGTPVWAVYQEQLASEKRELQRVPSLVLSPAPAAAAPRPPSADAWPECKRLSSLQASSSGVEPVPLPCWKPFYSDAVRAGSLDVTVANSPFKNSAFATCLPRVGKKKGT